MSDIILKDLIKDDLEYLRVWRNSEDVSKYMYTDDNISSEQQIKWFERVAKDQTQKYWIIEYENKKIGLASLYAIRPNFKSCCWAFYLGDASIRGAGIGAKIEYNVLKFVFDEMKFNKLLCEVFVFNKSVIKMHEKFGFRRESYFREHIFKNNEFLDVIGLAMLKREWDSSKEQHRKNIYER